jgi:hypothetical protein
MSDFDSDPIFATKARPLFDNAHPPLRNATNAGPLPGGLLGMKRS